MSATLERVRAATHAVWSEVPSRDPWPCLSVPREDRHALLAALRDACGFEMLTYLTAIDRRGSTPRFEVQVGLLSLQHKDRLRVVTRIPEEDAAVSTVTDLWPAAGFYERECYDMFGIRFDGHADLKRLLMPDGYGHHPLRKEFPHHGIEPDRLYREWDRSRRTPEETSR